MQYLGIARHGRPRPEEELREVIRRVRARWRTRRVLSGVAAMAGSALVVLAASAFTVEASAFAPWVARSLSLGAWALFALAAWRFVIRPLRARVSESRIALYVEEHDRSLEATVLSGVEFGKTAGRADTSDAGASPDLARLVVEEAIRRLEAIQEGRLVETSGLRRAAGGVVTVFGVAAIASFLAPPELLRGAGMVLSPFGDLESRNPYQVVVDPGDAAVARDSDRWIAARLVGFTAERVDLHTRVDGEERWTVLPMIADPETGDFRHLLLSIPEATDYLVDADGVRSPTYRIEVEDVPYTARIGLTYRYPAHTGLSPRRVEDGGDIAAVRGTVVDLEVEATVPALSGELRLAQDGDVLPLEPVGDAPEGALRFRASLALAESGAYRVALAGPGGALRTASRDYLIEVLDDLPPIVRFLAPGRDTTASPVEEVFTEVLAEDDYAVSRLEVRTAVNGGEETAGVLVANGRRPEARSAYTVFLEEHDLVPGDLVSYYAVAQDGVGGEAVTDMYFVAIRPFDRNYRQADSMPGGMGGGGMDGLDGTLTLRQKQVVVATFKLLRDKQGTSARTFEETVATVGLAQGRLREQVETLVRRLKNRGIGASPEFGQIVGHLDAGLIEMTAAEELLIGGDPERALPREQKALTHLQRADAVFRDVQVAFGGGGGGGGGGPRPQAEDLANLFELEIDKLRNQYETVEQQRRVSTDNEVDELMQRLAELARRQEQENERLRRGVTPPAGAGGAGSGQQRLAAETEEVARRLERLAREQSRPDLAAVSRRLRDAAQQMRAAQSRNPGEGLEAGLAAASGLRGARQDLDRNRRGRLARDVEGAIEETKRLRSAQDRIRRDVRDLEHERTREAFAGISEAKQDLVERVQELELQLDEVRRDWSRDEPEAARAVGEAADGIRDRKLKEKIRYSRGVAAQRTGDYANQFENSIAGDLEALEADLATARAAVEGSDRAGRDQALERAGRLVEGLESLRNRLADRAEDGGEGADRSGESGEARGAEGDPDGERGGAGGPPYGGGLGPHDAVRQLDRELSRRVEEAESLRDALTGLGEAGQRGREQLDPALAALRGLTADRLAGNPRGMEILEAEVLDTLRNLEFTLRRALSGTSGTEVLIGASDRAPEAWRDAVEEYFRNLSRR